MQLDRFVVNELVMSISFYHSGKKEKKKGVTFVVQVVVVVGVIILVLIIIIIILRSPGMSISSSFIKIVCAPNLHGQTSCITL